MYHQLQPSSTTQLYCIPYDRNLYLTVTSPDLPTHDREILSSKALTDITSISTDLQLNTSPRESDNIYFKQSDSFIMEQKLEKESTESDEQKSSSSGEPKSTSSEPRLGVKQLQLSRTDGNDCSNECLSKYTGE